MKNQKDLPKPLTDLPLPEKELSEHATPALKGETFRGYRKFLVFGIVFVIFLAIVGGAYFLGRNSVLKELNPTAPSIPPAGPVVYDPTADWETYTNTERGYLFKYPAGFTVKETSSTANTPENVTLEKDAEVIRSGGMGSGDALSKGVSIVFTIWPKKDLSETALKDQFGTNIQISKADIGGKEATKVILDETPPSLIYFYDYSPEVLEINSIVGASSTDQEKSNYLSAYNQILSTFKFTQ